MIELYECPECQALTDNPHGGYCRWHWKRPKTGPAPKEQTKRKVAHVTGRTGECFYCGEEEGLTREHVIPKSLGRQYNRTWNRVWACEFCNRKKADSQLSEWIRELNSYASTHGWDGVHHKYRLVLGRARHFVSHLLTDPSHEELKRHRAWIDPWYGEGPF